MRRLIDADALKRLVDEEWFDCQEKSSFFDEIDRTPTIDPAENGGCCGCQCTLLEQAPVKRGKWVSEKLYGSKTLKQIAWKHECSGCRYYICTTDEQIGWRYCPHCGTQMERSEE